MLLGVGFVFRERLLDSEIDGGAIGRPGKGVDVIFGEIERTRFAAICGDDPDAREGVFVLAVFAVGGFLVGKKAVGGEGDEAAVGGPVGAAVVTGVGERFRLAGGCAPEPEVFAEAVGHPVRFTHGDDGCCSIGRETGGGVFGFGEVGVEGERGFALGGRLGCESDWQQGGNERAGAAGDEISWMRVAIQITHRSGFDDVPKPLPDCNSIRTRTAERIA